MPKTLEELKADVEKALATYADAWNELAELEGEPLGAEFEAVWDANKEGLYEP
jgi:hypothetical protein